MLLYDEELYEYLYKRTLPDGRTIYYGRELLNLGNPPDWVNQERVLRRLEVKNNDRILLVGCGFSPLLTAFGLATIGIDPSPYIQKYQGTESDSPRKILPYALPDPRIQEALSSLGVRRKFDWVISDDALSSLEADVLIGRPGESEAEQFLAACDEFGLKVIHFVTTGRADAEYGHSMFTYKPLQEWQIMAPHHTWIDANAYEVIIGG